MENIKLHLVLTVLLLGALHALTAQEILLSTSSIMENNDVGDVIGELSSNNVGTGSNHTYSFVAGSGSANNLSFSLDGNVVKAAQAFDFEAKSSYVFRVESNDGNGNTHQEFFTVMIEDQESSLTLSNTTIVENNEVGEVVGTFTPTDVGTGDDYTYTLVSGNGSANNVQFDIVGDQLVADHVFDYEIYQNAVVRVQSDDGNGNLFETFFSITIEDQESSLALSNSTLVENNQLGEVVGTFMPTDIGTGDNYTYTLVSGNGSANNVQFEIVDNQLVADHVFDYEIYQTAVVRVQSDDGNGNLFEEFFSITIEDIETAITITNLSLEENNDVGDVVGELTSYDVGSGNSHTYSLVSGSGSANNLSFDIDGNQVVANQVFDFESKTEYVFRVESNDGEGNTYSNFFRFNVTDGNDSPTSLQLSNSDIFENSAAGSLVGILSSEDQDANQTLTYHLVSGEGDDDNQSFQIQGSNLNSASVFDFEVRDSYSIRVQTNDGNGGILEGVFSIAVSNENEGITVINPLADQNLQAGFGSTTISLSNVFEDTDGDDLTYEVSSSDGDVATAAIVNGEVQITEVGSGSCIITVEAFDGNGLSATDEFDLNVSTILGFSTTRLKVFPNPVIEKLNIISPEEMAVKLIDIKGRTLANGNGKEMTLTMSHLDKGIYFLQLSSKGKNWTKKVIKEN